MYISIGVVDAYVVCKLIKNDFSFEEIDHMKGMKTKVIMLYILYIILYIFSWILYIFPSNNIFAIVLPTVCIYIY